MGLVWGALWYRNTSAVSPWLAAISAESYLSAGGFDEHLPWQRSFPALCRAIGSSGKRGLVDSHARATLTAGELPAVPAFDESLKHDPYFHPAFSSVVPLELGKNSQASATSGAPHAGEQVLIVRPAGDAPAERPPREPAQLVEAAESAEPHSAFETPGDAAEEPSSPTVVSREVSQEPEAAPAPAWGRETYGASVG